MGNRFYCIVIYIIQENEPKRKLRSSLHMLIFGVEKKEKGIDKKEAQWYYINRRREKATRNEKENLKSS